MQVTPARRYALQRLAKGDYLLLSNDGNTMYRVKQYLDGPSGGLMDMKHDKTFWAVWEWTGITKWRYELSGDDLDICNKAWVEIQSGCKSRTEAIEAILQRGLTDVRN